MSEAGASFGVEEEYHLVNPDDGRLMPCPQLSACADRGAAGARLHPEMLTTQLEAASNVCTDLSQLRGEVLDMRAEAARVAARYGAALLPTSTHPTAMLDEVHVAERDRYARLLERHAGVVGQLNLCGCHVHVSVPDLDTAVAVMNHTRRFLPVLAALTGSSPFHEASDTGFASIRLARLALWPQGGPPPHLDSAQHYLDLVNELIGTGIIDEPSELLWELRPSTRYPTVEFRIADMCPDVDDVVLLAGLIRSLVRTALRLIAAGEPVPSLADTALVAARWRAARYGLTGQLWSVHRSELAPAAEVVGELWQVLLPDLVEHGEDIVLEPLLSQLLHRGTSATRQRQVFTETRSLAAVVSDAILASQ